MNKNMNPAAVASARTARLVREAATPTYSTSTPRKPERQHMTAVEVESGMGRYWRTMPENKVDDFCNNLPASYDISDIDHSANCWCFA